MSASCGHLQTVVKGESACGIVLLEKEAYNSSIGTRMGGGRI